MADKEWTIMVYMAGDNDLNIEMAYALEQIGAITKVNKNINLYVYFDGFSRNVPTLYCNFSDSDSTNVNFYQSSKIKDKLIKRKRSEEDDFNENSASINNIINFVHWCVKKDKYTTANGINVDRRKDKKYAMIFSGHSFGFLDWGLFKDEKADWYMTLSKLQWMFERITSEERKLRAIAEKEEKDFQEKYKRDWSEEYRIERTTEILGKPLDLLGFDSCVMSTLEIGSQFKGLAKTMVASEGSIPSAGWNYAQILLGKLKDQPESNAEEVAISFVDEFIKQQNKFALADISVDISAWDLTGLTDLEESFEELVVNLINCFKDEKSTSYNQMRRLLTQVHWECQTYLYEQHVDLGDFCQLLEKEINLLKTEIDDKKIAPIIEVGKSCRKVINNLRKCILLTGFSGSDFQFSNGMSLFFPWSLASYESAEKDYNKLSFIKENDAGKKWNEFLVKYLNQVTFRKSNPLNPTDKDGNVIIVPETESIAYQSYILLNEDTKFGDETKQPPGGPRQPPGGPRQPPGGPRLFSNMSIFLSRFMKLKNFQSNWNQAGFTSKKVKFKAKSDTKLPHTTQEQVPDIVEVVIERGISINKVLEDIFLRLKELGENNRENVNIEEYAELLNEIAQNLDNQTTVELLENLSKSNLFGSIYDKEEDLNTLLKNRFSKSISSINDLKVRDDLTKKIDIISSKK